MSGYRPTWDEKVVRAATLFAVVAGLAIGLHCCAPARADAVCAVTAVGKGCNEQATCCPPLRCVDQGGVEAVDGHCQLLTTPTTTRATTTTAPASTTTSGPPTTSTTLPAPARAALRPTVAELSLATARSGTGYNYSSFYQWFRGRTATQTERDVLEAQAAVYFVQAIAYVHGFDGSDAVAQKAVGQLNLLTARLLQGYEMRELVKPGGGRWIIQIGGHHYSAEQYGEEAIQGFLLQAKHAAQCGATIPPELATLLDVRVVNGRCVRGTLNAAPAVPVEPYDGARALTNLIQSNVPRPPLLPSQVALLHAADDCHGGRGPAGCSTDALLQAFEASARNATEQHFFQMSRFSGKIYAQPEHADGWTPDEAMAWHRAQDAPFHAWAAEVEGLHGDLDDHRPAGRWGFARMHDDDHSDIHVCGNLWPDAGVMVRLSCYPTDIHECPVLTCREALGDCQRYARRPAGRAR